MRARRAKALSGLVLASVVLASGHASAYGTLSFSCDVAYEDYYAPAFRAIAGTKYTGLNRQDIDSIVNTCRKVVDHKEYLYDSRCRNFPLFQSQLRQMIDVQCPFYLDTYGKDFPPPAK